MRDGSRTPTDVDILVGENVRSIRTENNLTLSELGSALGISHQQLQKYETGANRLSAGMLSKVSHVLNVPIETLFINKSETVSKETAAESLHKQIALRAKRTNDKETLERAYAVLKVLIP
jgi:transcriptional regulator with XRE-family HTH domain